MLYTALDLQGSFSYIPTMDGKDLLEALTANE